MFVPRSQTDGEGTANPETGSGGIGGDVCLTKSSQLSMEDLSGRRWRAPPLRSALCSVRSSSFLSSGEDPETRRLRTVRNIADLRQNLEETMSSLRGTQVTHR